MKETIQYVALNRIDSAQIRAGLGDEEALLGLAASMASVGLQQPVRLRPVEDRFRPIDGHRRVEVARRLKWTEIASIVEALNLSETDAVLRGLIANVQRLDMTDVERGRTFDRIIRETGWTAAEVSRQAGVSESTVSRLTAVVSDPVIAAHLERGELRTSTAYALVSVRDPAERARLTQEAVAGRLTREAVTSRAGALPKRTVSPKPRRPRVQRERVVIPMGERRSVVVSAPSLSVEALITWLTELTERIRTAGLDGRSLTDVVKAIASQSR